MSVTAGLAGFGWVGGAWSTLRAAGSTLQHRFWLLSVEGEKLTNTRVCGGKGWHLCFRGEVDRHPYFLLQYTTHIRTETGSVLVMQW